MTDSRRGTNVTMTIVAIVTAVVVVLGMLLWSLWQRRCHTVFVLDDPKDIRPVATGILVSGADMKEIWHMGPGTVGGLAGADLEEAVARYAASPGRRITGFRLSRIVSRDSLGPLADDIIYELRVRPWANVSAPAPHLDPPTQTSAPCSSTSGSEGTGEAEDELPR